MISNQRKIVSTYHGLTGYVVVPLWLEPEDVLRWNTKSPQMSGLDDSHILLTEYGPYVREWHLDFEYTDERGDPQVAQIRTYADALKFGRTPPAQLALIAIETKRAIENFFGPASAELQPSKTGTAGPQ